MNSKCEEQHMGWKFAKSQYMRKSFDLCVPPPQEERKNLSNGSKLSNWYNRYGVLNDGYSTLTCWFGSNKEDSITMCRVKNLYAYVSENVSIWYQLREHKIYDTGDKGIGLRYILRCRPVYPYWNQRAKYIAQWKGQSGAFHPFQDDLKIDYNLPQQVPSHYYFNETWHIKRGEIGTNPWHALADLTTVWIIETLFNETRDNSKLIEVLGFESLYLNHPIRVLLSSLFKHIEMEPPNFNSSNYPSVANEFLIQHAMYDPSPWLSLLWKKGEISCPLPFQRSPLLFQFRDFLNNFLMSQSEIRDYDWITEVIEGKKNWRVLTNFKFGNFYRLKTMNNGTLIIDTNETLILKRPTLKHFQNVIQTHSRPILFYSSRYWENGRDIHHSQSLCKHRCIHNYRSFIHHLLIHFPYHYFIIGNLAPFVYVCTISFTSTC
ncbi:hypothetical protein RFI_23371 [Reticulomyxa filosa]|uniref:Uncharacterized protein n=1 Tax=Reticulomyxa filosa TaxID=46433 RepID=X6MJH7_RETFI|nr:hypothetical protein RFI_23371 [Reticulomyxa filosa]|eukprot:ETO13999.1 hypothetical protein RFI_23371 [Reticulomyxa filosa]